MTILVHIVVPFLELTDIVCQANNYKAAEMSAHKDPSWFVKLISDVSMTTVFGTVNLREIWNTNYYIKV